MFEFINKQLVKFKKNSTMKIPTTLKSESKTTTNFRKKNKNLAHSYHNTTTMYEFYNNNKIKLNLKNYTICLLMFLSTLFCFGQEKAIPNGMRIMAETMGDLDNDGIDEKVVVYDTNESTVSGNIREIWILKNKNGKWTEWQKSRNAIRKSKEGGKRGEPFEGINIKNNVLSIHFSGGTNWIWTYTDKYKFQNNQFELVNHTSNFSKPCDHWESVDFNLSTGKMIVKNGYDTCKNQELKKSQTKNTKTFYKKRIHMTLQNRDGEMWNGKSFSTTEDE